MWKTLIVEDNTTFRQMLKEILYSKFPTMNIAEEPDGNQLFLTIDVFHPQIVLMDIRLPGESGLELAKKIKKNYPDFARRLDDPAIRNSMGLSGAVKWPVMLCGYLLHALNRSAAEVRQVPYVPRDSDSTFI